MNENPKLEDMGLDNLSSNCEAGELGEKISVSDHVHGFQSIKSESFVVDMERFSHLIEKDINANSRITLQRNLSRKGSGRAGEKKIIANERDIHMLSTSPRATLYGGGSTPEKPAIMTLGATDHSIIPQVQHQITITNGTIGSAAAGESKLGGKRFSFRRSPPTWLDPRRILLFFATLSCLGTIVLIYFTLSLGKLNGDENALD